MDSAIKAAIYTREDGVKVHSVPLPYPLKKKKRTSYRVGDLNMVGNGPLARGKLAI